MQENGPITWTSIIQDLETAAVLPSRREALITRALEHLLGCIPAVATALIWPCQQCRLSWKVFYTGIKRQSMHRWLTARLDTSAQVMFSQLQHDLAHTQDEMLPSFLPLHSSFSSSGGVWIVWMPASATSTLANLVPDEIERVRKIFEALLEVKDLEERYFSPSSPLYDKELIEALAQGDDRALSAVLSLTRVVTQADCTFWARVDQKELETLGHLGAKHSGFGFTLPRGRGLGGNAAASGTLILIDDSRNSSYRDPSVSDIVDREHMRTAIAMPVRFRADSHPDAPVEAVLYTTRRTLRPFSPTEKLLIQRQGHLFQQISLEKRSRPFFLPTPLSEFQTVWQELVLHANRIEAVEEWASQVVRGSVIVTDPDGYPYAATQSEHLEEIHDRSEAAQVLPLTAPGVARPGKVYLWPSISLPPFQWPEFSSDLMLSCNAVIARMEQQHNFLGNQRKQWLRTLLQGNVSPHTEQEGYRLGLPMEHGQVWILAWSPETAPATKLTRQRTIAENVVLDALKSPPIFLDHETAIILLEGPPLQSPSRVRDALLKACGARPLWLIHGARYQSFPDLKMTLSHTIPLAQKARREELDEYVLDVYAFDIDSLLENPRMTSDLDIFARKLLTPLLEYDAANNSQFTETFVLVQTLGSIQEVADKLGVHVNTIRYRLHKAEEILGKELASPKEHMALALASFIWERFALSEQAEQS